ncbi:MAG: biotin/lipoyl-containing protein [Bacillota bacterium]
MRKFIVNVNGIDYNVEVREENSIESVKPAPVLAQSAPKAVVQQPPTPAPVAAPAPVVRPVVTATVVDGFNVNAPMPGKIIKVAVAVGQAVSQGDVVIILEAMKMQNEIKTPVDGVVKAINVEPGQTVKPGETMVVIG